MIEDNKDAEPFDRSDYLKFQSAKSRMVSVNRERLCATILDTMVEQGRLAGLSEACGAYRAEADNHRRLRTHAEVELSNAVAKLAHALCEIEELRLDLAKSRKRNGAK